jgi:hypothetical protein
MLLQFRCLILIGCLQSELMVSEIGLALISVAGVAQIVALWHEHFVFVVSNSFAGVRIFVFVALRNWMGL